MIVDVFSIDKMPLAVTSLARLGYWLLQTLDQYYSQDPGANYTQATLTH